MCSFHVCRVREFITFLEYNKRLVSFLSSRFTIGPKVYVRMNAWLDRVEDAITNKDNLAAGLPPLATLRNAKEIREAFEIREMVGERSHDPNERGA